MSILVTSIKEVEDLLQKNPPTIRGFKKDKLFYIIAKIYGVQYWDGNGVAGAALCAATLQDTLGKSYKGYIDYLFTHNVIVSISGYTVGESCRRYILTNDYYGLPEWYTLTDFTFKQKLSMNPRVKRFSRKYPNLELWFAGLNIDMQGAQACVDDDFRLKSNNPELQDFSASHPGTPKDCCKQYLHNMMMLEYFKTREFPYIIDANGHRAHTILTRSSKMLRNFMTYCGQHLVSIDLKNSQPYLLLCLLKEEFWDVKKRKNVFPTVNNSILISQYHTLYIHSIMLGLSSVNTYCKEFQAYEGLVKSGKMYEHFLARMIADGYQGKLSRSIVKFKMMLCLYSKNNTYSGGMKTAFRKSFPKIYELICAIKEERHNTLPLLLQRIESYLILDVICKRISRERPDLPIFTVHDSIVTTEGNQAYIKEVIEDEMTRYVGVPPIVSYERWKPENALKKIAGMKQRLVDEAAKKSLVTSSTLSPEQTNGQTGIKDLLSPFPEMNSSANAL